MLESVFVFIDWLGYWVVVEAAVVADAGKLVVGG